MYILTPDNSDGSSLSAIGPFTSLAAAMDWRTDAERQGVIHAGRYGLEALQEPQPLAVSTAMGDPAFTELLQYTDIGNGYHCWLTDDGPITVTRGELRQAFEAAYDPANPKWAMMVDLSGSLPQNPWRMP